MSMFGLRRQETDPVDDELPEHLRAVQLVDWLALIARLDIPSERKTVAMMAAAWASHDGTEIRPALQTIADMAKRHETNARKHLKALIELGMLAVKRAGGGRGNPTVYRLTRPADLTVLPLWLDPDMRRVPFGSGFAPVKTPAPALGNEDSSNTDSLAAALPSTPETPAAPKTVYESEEVETLAPALPNRPETLVRALPKAPVDNPGEAEKGSDSSPKPQRSEPRNAETPAPALPDLLQADQTTDQLPGLPQAANSLGWRERGPAPAAVAAAVRPAAAEPWHVSLRTPHRPVGAAAGLAPTPAAFAAIALLDADPGGDWYRARATRELRAEGIRHPTSLDIAIRAVAILRRTQTETRSA